MITHRTIYVFIAVALAWIKFMPFCFFMMTCFLVLSFVIDIFERKQVRKSELSPVCAFLFISSILILNHLPIISFILWVTAVFKWLLED